MSFLTTCFVVSLLLVGTFAQTFVPLVAYSDSINNDTIQVGAFTPNGTLAVGQTDIYYITLNTVPSGYGISIYVEYMNGPILQVPADAMLYLKRGQSPTAFNFDQSQVASCYAVPCYFAVPPSIGVCGPQSGNWYFSIANTNQNQSLTYTLSVAIDIYGGDIFDCAFASNAGGFFTGLIIAIFVIVGLVVLAIVGGIICCCCCCAAAAGGVAIAASYQPVPEYRPVQPAYGAAPQYAPPQNMYPPPANNNIQYNPDNNKKV